MAVPSQETMHDLLRGSQLVLDSEYARIIPVHGAFSIRKSDNTSDLFTLDDSGNATLAGSLTTTGGDTFDSDVLVKVTSATAFDVQNASGTSYFKVNTSATPAITIAAPTTNSFVGGASKPALKLSGAWFTGGSATTTKPQLLVEDSAATTTGWSTSGTGIGVNALTGFAGNLIDLQVNGTSFAKISAAGLATVVGLTTSGPLTNSTASLVSAPASKSTGAWYTGGSATTTKPHMLVEPSTATSTGWSTSGTGLGVNADTGFAGNLLDLQVNGTSKAKISAAGLGTLVALTIASGLATFNGAGAGPTMLIYDPTASTGYTQIKIRAGAGQSGNTILSVRNSADSGTLFSISDTGGFVSTGAITATSAAASAIGTTAAGLTLSTTTSGTLAVTSAGLLTLTGVGASVWTPGAGATIVSDTGTGITIGTGITQKLGFYNATPIAQRAGAAQAAVVTTAATLTTPYGYATQAQADAIVALVNELRAWAVVQGFIKGSA